VTSRADLAVEASGLVKCFGDTQAVDGLDLTVPAGSVYGLLGPNGAGKTTTIRMLATLVRPDGGTAADHAPLPQEAMTSFTQPDVRGFACERCGRRRLAARRGPRR
jgi:ABC-type multidrug transport system ATPase subunit